MALKFVLVVVFLALFFVHAYATDEIKLPDGMKIERRSDAMFDTTTIELLTDGTIKFSSALTEEFIFPVKHADELMKILEKFIEWDDQARKLNVEKMSKRIGEIIFDESNSLVFDFERMYLSDLVITKRNPKSDYTFANPEIVYKNDHPPILLKLLKRIPDMQEEMKSKATQFKGVNKVEDLFK
jgi:hypothetical protein